MGNFTHQWKRELHARRFSPRPRCKLQIGSSVRCILGDVKAVFSLANPVNDNVPVYHKDWRCASADSCSETFWMGKAGKITAAVTEMHESCVGEGVGRESTPILYLSQPALLYVTAETLVNRLTGRLVALSSSLIP